MLRRRIVQRLSALWNGHSRLLLHGWPHLPQREGTFLGGSLAKHPANHATDTVYRAVPWRCGSSSSCEWPWWAFSASSTASFTSSSSFCCLCCSASRSIDLPLFPRIAFPSHVFSFICPHRYAIYKINR